jgi:hypothetical protein
MAITDLIQQMTKECRRLAAVARSADDRTFWLGLVERWEAVESRKRDNIARKKARSWAACKSIAPAREERRPGLVQPGILSRLVG